MAVTTKWYATAMISAFSKLIDFTSTTKINAVLTTSSYTPNQDTHQYHSSITNQLSTANGYTSESGADSGLSLTGSSRVTDSSLVVKLDTDDPAWTATGAGFTARIIVLTDVASGVSATDPLVLYSDFGADQTASGGGTFTYVVAGGGWATITVS